jgi:hypothetical protein
MRQIVIVLDYALLKTQQDMSSILSTFQRLLERPNFSVRFIVTQKLDIDLSEYANVIASHDLSYVTEWCSQYQRYLHQLSGDIPTPARAMFVSELIYTKRSCPEGVAMRLRDRILKFNVCKSHPSVFYMSEINKKDQDSLYNASDLLKEQNTFYFQAERFESNLAQCCQQIKVQLSGPRQPRRALRIDTKEQGEESDATEEYKTPPSSPPRQRKTFLGRKRCLTSRIFRTAMTAAPRKSTASLRLHAEGSDTGFVSMHKDPNPKATTFILTLSKTLK